MDEILNDLARLRRLVAEAAKEHGNGNDVSDRLATIGEDVSHLMERVEALLEAVEREGLDQKTRFVSELAGTFLRAMMERPGAALTDSNVQQAVDMAAEVVKRVQARI